MGRSDFLAEGLYLEYGQIHHGQGLPAGKYAPDP